MIPFVVEIDFDQVTLEGILLSSLTVREVLYIFIRTMIDE